MSTAFCLSHAPPTTAQLLETLYPYLSFTVTVPLQCRCRVVTVPLPRRYALLQARLGRLHILGRMKDAMPTPSVSLPPSVPRFVKLTVEPDMVGRIIGKGGETINGIIASTGVTNIAIDKPGTVRHRASSNRDRAQIEIRSTRDRAEIEPVVLWRRPLLLWAV